MFSKKILSVMLVGLFLCSTLVGCAPGYKSDKMENGVTLEKGDTVAVMEVKGYGVIKIKLQPEFAPKAVENFVTHSKNGYYDGLTFHRVIADFMIQGGDPSGAGSGGSSIWGAPFEDEFDEKAINVTGALSMANAGVNTNGSQFFIINGKPIDEALLKESFPDLSDEAVKAYVEHGGSPHLDGVHTVFGMVYSGMDVVDKIMKTEASEENNKPLKSVVIKTIKIHTVE